MISSRSRLWSGDAAAWAARGVTEADARFDETVAFRVEAGDPATISNLARIFNVLLNTERRDIGSVAVKINKKLQDLQVPSGMRVQLKGEYSRMRESFAWFLGANRLGISVYDPATAGCRDGVSETALNVNQGAESTVSFLISLIEMLDLAGEGLEYEG